MEVIDLSKENSIIGQYMAEMRDAEYQKNRLLFRNNIMRMGEYEAFEVSKRLNYEQRDVATPLGIARVNVPTDKIVLATIFRAGLPFHQGFLNIFDMRATPLCRLTVNTPIKSITRWAYTWNTSLPPASTRKH